MLPLIKIDFPNACGKRGTSRTSRGRRGGAPARGAKLFWSLGASAAGELFINRTNHPPPRPAPGKEARRAGFSGATLLLPGLGTAVEGQGSRMGDRVSFSRRPPILTFPPQDLGK